MVNYPLIVVGILVGSLIGLVFAYRVQMTQMPEMVALFNGFGGAASSLVAVSEIFRILMSGAQLEAYSAITIALSILIGGITLTGSFVAFGKLSGLMPGKPIVYPLQKLFNAALFAAT